MARNSGTQEVREAYIEAMKLIDLKGRTPNKTTMDRYREVSRKRKRIKLTYNQWINELKEDEK